MGKGVGRLRRAATTERNLGKAARVTWTREHRTKGYPSTPPDDVCGLEDIATLTPDAQVNSFGGRLGPSRYGQGPLISSAAVE